jgi:aspartate carbamoyltransferase catalytic subunit
MERLTHVIEAQQFTKEWLEEEFFPLVMKMERVVKETGILPFSKYFFVRRALAGKRMVSFFYEPSTRTRMSFEMAMERLGGEVVFSTENAKEFSSVAKGEKIEDTIRVICGYHPDVIVLRANEEGMAERAAKFSTVPIINAGDGPGQHPTQALLDLYTIQERLGRISDTWMAMTGDLNKGRTVRSLAYLYAKFPNVKISFVSPEAAKMREDVKDYLKRYGVWFEEIHDLREVADKVDIIYSTRIQKERGSIVLRYGSPSFWTVNKEVLDLMTDDAIVMHPLPHLDEIAPEVDNDPRAVYFRQAENGLYIRMALLKKILE